MAERDRFELDLALALRAYAEEAPTQVSPGELARRFAVDHPRQRVAFDHRRFRVTPAVPGLAWASLLLAALLTAMLAGTLIVGSQRGRELPAVMPPVAPSRVAPSLAPAYVCPPGSNPDEPGPVDQARPPSFDVSMAFDRAAGKIVALGADGTWTFDVCTNTWTRMHPASRPAFDLFRMLVYDAATGRSIYVVPGGVWAYDVASDAWTRQGDAPEMDVLQVRLVSDPVAGRVQALELGAPGPTWSGQMWSYDAGADAWQPVAQVGHLSADEGRQLLLAYDQSVDRLVGYSLDGEVHLFDLRTGTWSAPASTPPPFQYGTLMMNPFSFGGEIAYDQAARRTVLFSHGVVIAYDAAADLWETLYRRDSAACATPPECRTSPHMVYDPVNERLVVYGGTFWSEAEQRWLDPDDVLAFDTRSREWAVLLDPSPRQSGNGPPD